MKYFLFSIVIVLCFFQGKGQSMSEISKAYQIFETRGEVYFRFNYPAEGKKSPLLKKISVDKFENGKIYAYASRKEFEKVTEELNGLEVLTAPSLLYETNMAKNLKEVQAWNVYPTYSQYTAMMDSFASAHPTICRKEIIGTTVNGRQLQILKISDNVSQKEAEPEFLYTSTMHGDELTGAILLLRLTDLMLQNYGTDPEITALVNNTEIWINPLANPDGTYFLGDNTVSGAMRYNGNFIDLNRNFRDPQDGDHPDGNDWQPETEAWMTFMGQHNFVMSANFHGGAEVMNYPWDTYTFFHADDEWLQLVSREYVDTVHTFNNTGYLTDLNNGITNGNAWYEIDGGRQDYATFFHHCREICIEISADKKPPASELPDFWDWNNRSLINYMKQVQYGIHGIVTDSVTGEPLRAFIEVLQHDTDSSQIYTCDTLNGNYHRLIKEGTYTMRFSSPGYISKTLSGIQANDYAKTTLDVQLVKFPQSDPLISENIFAIYPNPNNGQFTVVSKINEPFTSQVFSSDGRPISATASEHKGTLIIDLKSQPKGVYIIKITTKRETLIRKIIVQ